MWIGDLDLAEAERTAAEIGAHAAQLDVCDPGSFADFHAAASVHGLPAMLVNNAGIQVMGPFAEQRLDVYHREVAVNLIGPINGMHTFLPGMLERNHGHIVNISSISGKVGLVGQTNYSAAKAGIVGLTKAAAKEMAHHGIRVNAIAPGLIDTPMTQAGRTDPQLGAAMDAFLELIPAGRAGRPEEIAALAQFLLGPESGYCVGSVVFADGGLDAQQRPTDWPRPASPPEQE